MLEKVKIGIIGCGNISAIYLQNCKKFPILDVVACADLDMDRARARAEEFGIKRACTVAELLADPEIELIVNLTIPAAHADVCIQSLEAGKHVYVEKPLAATIEDGRRILSVAAAKGLKVGAAPETFLGGGIQTCKKLIDDGWIGDPIAAVAFMMAPGHERWHPDPEFYYKEGGGPLFDMGPYYLTALINLLGPIRRITGSVKTSFPTRTITSEAKYGQEIEVEVPTHVAGVLDFTEGATVTLITSFDIMAGSTLPRIEIYGSQGSLQVPDPNRFGGPVLFRGLHSDQWMEMPLTHGYTSNLRGIGVADMGYAIRKGRPHRAHGELAFHVLEAMHGLYEASHEGRHYEMESTVTLPQIMPRDVLPYTLD